MNQSPSPCACSLVSVPCRSTCLPRKDKNQVFPMSSGARGADAVTSGKARAGTRGDYSSQAKSRTTTPDEDVQDPVLKHLLREFHPDVICKSLVPPHHSGVSSPRISMLSRPTTMSLQGTCRSGLYQETAKKWKFCMNPPESLRKPMWRLVFLLIVPLVSDLNITYDFERERFLIQPMKMR